MKRPQMKIFITVLLLACATIAGCSGNAGKTEKTGEKEATSSTETEEKTGTLELTEDQMQTVGIETGLVGQRNLTSVVKANGQLAVPPQNKADISLLSGGTIGKISVLEGQQVRRGQLLATINNQDMIKIQQDYLTAKNSLIYVQQEFDRQSQLKEAGAGTGKSYQSAAATLNTEQARITAYESQLRQLGIAPGRINNGNIVSSFPVVSPINGTVGNITANLGAFVQPGTSIMEVVDNSSIHCDLTVFEKDLMRVKVGQKVNFQLTNQDNQNIIGVINGINKSFTNESKGVIVHAVIHNAQNKNLIPGMYVTALISTGSELTPAVPVDAVVRAEGKSFIFVVAGQEKDTEGKVQFKFKKAEVITGVAELGYVQIKPVDELSPDTKVVLKGAFYLQSKATGGGEEE
jgi:cobalt-zinc-cadmium efflux system membrane fusion protein